jgi:hypothetical protein
MNDYFYERLRLFFYRFWHCRLVEKENIPLHGPAVFASNHLDSYAPVAVDQEAKAIHIAPPVSFIPECLFSSEKERIKTALQDLITEMLTSPKIHRGKINKHRG